MLEKVQSLGPPRLQKGLEEWNSEQGLLLFRGKVYVPKNTELWHDIVQIHHDSLAVGQPGRWKTLELVSQNYWWPGMSKFIHEYVDTCDACNCTKTSPPRQLRTSVRRSMWKCRVYAYINLPRHRRTVHGREGRRSGRKTPSFQGMHLPPRDQRVRRGPRSSLAHGGADETQGS